MTRDLIDPGDVQGWDPRVADALGVIRALLGSVSDEMLVGKCIGYELWIRDAEFSILHPTDLVGESVPRFVFRLPGGSLLGVVPRATNAISDAFATLMAKAATEEGYLLESLRLGEAMEPPLVRIRSNAGTKA